MRYAWRLPPLLALTSCSCGVIAPSGPPKVVVLGLGLHRLDPVFLERHWRGLPNPRRPDTLTPFSSMGAKEAAE